MISVYASQSVKVNKTEIKMLLCQGKASFPLGIALGMSAVGRAKRAKRQDICMFAKKSEK